MWTMRVRPSSRPSASITGEQSKAAIAVALVEVQHDHDAVLTGAGGEGVDQSDRERFRPAISGSPDAGRCGWKRLERQLRESTSAAPWEAASSTARSPCSMFCALSTDAACWTSAIFTARSYRGELSCMKIYGFEHEEHMTRRPRRLRDLRFFVIFVIQPLARGHSRRPPHRR